MIQGMVEPMSEEVWEKVWTKPLITSDYSLKYLAFMEKIEKKLPDYAIVAEAGCGTGQTLTLFSKRHMAIALDISPPALDLARKTADPHLILGTIFSIPLRDETCDLVYNSGVIEHFRDPHNTEAVREMARVVKKGGHVIVIVPNSYCPWYRLGKWVAVILQKFEFGYEEDYSLSRLRSVMVASGLTVVSEFGLQALPPLATNAHEILPERWRKSFGRLENILPFRQHYAYAVGIIAKKALKSGSTP
jgi:ubiquinone/menaquinone biosynthesis C-methylase UbiE